MTDFFQTNDIGAKERHLKIKDERIDELIQPKENECLQTNSTKVN